MTPNYLTLAIRIAVDAHGDTRDKGGMPYILHPLYVMASVDHIDAKIVAVLHDVIEDTYYTLDDLRFAGFSYEVISAVDAITKRKLENNEDYWSRVKANPLALQVKLADIAHNMSFKRLSVFDESEQNYLRNKYTAAIKFLNG